jgi:hypothetical protein
MPGRARVAAIACVALVLFGCASKKAERAEDRSVAHDLDVPPAAYPQRHPLTQVPPPLEVPGPDVTTGKLQQLGEISSRTPGADEVRRGPCTLDTCAIVLGIAVHDMTQSIARDDGGPGTYLPQGLYSAQTAGQPGAWDAYGLQKIVRVWDISVLQRDSTVQVIKQRNEPLFRVGDQVLVDGNTILPWN